ncbi:hypothetical protein ACFL54_08440, partial [Planctomycetota bacterium]
ADVKKQRQVFNFMQKAYNVRSKIVHGSDPNLPKKEDGTSYTLEGFCEEIERYLRIAIKKAMETPNGIDWDSVIYQGE